MKQSFLWMGIVCLVIAEAALTYAVDAPVTSKEITREDTQLVGVLPYRVDLNKGRGSLNAQNRSLTVLRETYHSTNQELQSLFWVLDGTSDDDTKDRTPIGIVNTHFETAADVVFIPSRNEFFLVLAGHGRGQLGIRMFALDLKKPLAINPMSLLGKSPSE